MYVHTYVRRMLYVRFVRCWVCADAERDGRSVLGEGACGLWYMIWWHVKCVFSWYVHLQMQGKPSYSLTVSPSLFLPCADSVVQNVIASDCDTGENSNISYTIRGNQDQNFRVVNGIIRVNGVLDFEQDQQFILTVVAQDNGVPPLSSSAEVCVCVCMRACVCMRVCVCGCMCY